MFHKRALESDVRELSARANALTWRKQRLRQAILAWGKETLTGPAMLTWCAAAGAWWGTGYLKKRRARDADDADESKRTSKVVRAGLSSLLVFSRLARPVARHLETVVVPAEKDDTDARTYRE